MNWIIYSLINCAIFLLVASVLFLFALAIPVVVGLCVLGMSLSYLREQKQSFTSLKLSKPNLQIIKFNDLAYWLAGLIRTQILRIVGMTQELSFRPVLIYVRSYQAKSSATLAPRNRRL